MTLIQPPPSLLTIHCGTKQVEAVDDSQATTDSDCGGSSAAVSGPIEGEGRGHPWSLTSGGDESQWLPVLKGWEHQPATCQRTLQCVEIQIRISSDVPGPWYLSHYSLSTSSQVSDEELLSYKPRELTHFHMLGHHAIPSALRKLWIILPLCTIPRGRRRLRFILFKCS